MRRLTIEALRAGAFGMNSDFRRRGRGTRLNDAARPDGAPVWFLLTDRQDDACSPGAHAARAEGAPLTAQIAGRPIGVMMA